MNRDELRESIVRPASASNLQFEAGLPELILDDIGVEAGSLPLMEFCLRELWEQRKGDLLTHTAYLRIGRARGAITTRAEQAFASLTSAQQEVAPVLFRRLVRISRPEEESGDARMRVRRTELRDDLYEVVVALADARLLVISSGLTGEIIEVAHEALIRNWERLRRWIDSDREFMLWRQRLDLAVDVWEQSSRSSDCLWHGSVLNEAERWQEQRAADLSHAEGQFIAAGVEVREQRIRDEELERKRRAKEQRERRILMGLGIATLVALALLAPLYQRQRRMSLSRELAITARSQLVSAEPQIALDPALRAIAAWHTREAEEALHAAVQGSGPPELEGHTEKIFAIAYSFDGQRIATASEDSSLRFWIPDKDLFRAEASPTTLDAKATSVAFRPNARQVAAGAGDGSVRLLQIGSRAPLWSVAHHKDAVMSLAFVGDGDSLYSAGWDGQVIQISAADGHVLASKNFGIPLAGAHPNPQRRLVAVVLNSNAIVLWDTQNDSVVRLEHCPGCSVAAMWYASGEKLVTAGSDGVISVWSADGKDRLRCVTPPDHLQVIAVSPDGQYIAAGGTSKSLHILDGATCEQLLTLAGHKSNISSIVFPALELMRSHPQVAAGAEDGTVRIYDLSLEQLKVRATRMKERHAADH
jgi:hypothetical protein